MIMRRQLLMTAPPSLLLSCSRPSSETHAIRVRSAHVHSVHADGLHHELWPTAKVQTKCSVNFRSLAWACSLCHLASVGLAGTLGGLAEAAAAEAAGQASGAAAHCGEAHQQ